MPRIGKSSGGSSMLYADGNDCTIVGFCVDFLMVDKVFFFAWTLALHTLQPNLQEIKNRELPCIVAPCFDVKGDRMSNG